MTTNRLSFLLLCLGCLYVFPSQAASQPECPTIKYVEDLNKDAVKRIAHIKSKNAIVFIALDPIWSAAEFQHEGYIDRGFIISDAERESLVKAGIDEIVIWELTQTHGLAVAVPFKDGCAVRGYGEADYQDKLIKMHKAFLLISKYGLDNPSVRDGIKNILMGSRYAGEFYAKGSSKDGMIDVVLDNLRPLMTNENSLETSKSKVLHLASESVAIEYKCIGEETGINTLTGRESTIAVTYLIKISGKMATVYSVSDNSELSFSVTERDSVYILNLTIESESKGEAPLGEHTLQIDKNSGAFKGKGWLLTPANVDSSRGQCELQNK